MSMKKWLITGLVILGSQVQAARLKVGVLAPEGTNWAKNMKKMAKEVKKATDGEVKFNSTLVDLKEMRLMFLEK